MLLAGLGILGKSYTLLRLGIAQPAGPRWPLRQQCNGIHDVIDYVAGGGVGVEKSDPVVGAAVHPAELALR